MKIIINAKCEPELKLAVAAVAKSKGITTSVYIANLLSAQEEIKKELKKTKK